MRNLKTLLFLIFCFGIMFTNMQAQHEHHKSSTKNNSKNVSNHNAKMAMKTFERLKKLEGKWKGKSTKGWEEEVSYRVIAAGSVIVANSFDAHPNETMMTMYHMDGDKLMLTHYCVAKNQPRLVATSFSEDGNTITFTFKDATNIPSRDKGHMDKLILKFTDQNNFTSQWTWYQNGKENWMEEIKMKRIKDTKK